MISIFNSLLKRSLFFFFVFVAIFIISSCKKPQVLSESEINWLKSNPNLVVGISPNAPPYQFVNDDGVLEGIFIEYLSLIEESINYKFIKYYESDFSKLIDKIKNNEIQVLLEVQSTEERRKYLNFTPSLVSHSHVIVVKKSNNQISGIFDLKNKKVSVVNLYAIQEFLSKNYPELNLVSQFDDIECLRSVSSGLTDAFVCQQAVATYYIEKEGISNLKIIDDINYPNDLSIVSTKKLDTLNIILTKAVSSISINKINQINQKWFTNINLPFYKTTSFWIRIIILILFALLIMLLFVLILNKKVKLKTKQYLEAKEKAEESDRLKSAFVANISHEIRTPLNGILGFVQILQDKIQTTKDTERYFKIIEDSGIQLTKIIEDLIDISRIEANQISLSFNKVDLNLLFKETELYFISFNKNPNLKIEYIESDISVVLTTDIVRLKQVLYNLIINAIKFTDNGDVQFGFLLKSDFVEIFVKDTGIGIDSSFEDKIFKSFNQADNGQNRKYSGSGLGLSISKSIVALLGGKIWFTSKLNTGSVFYFTIPLKEINL